MKKLLFSASILALTLTSGSIFGQKKPNKLGVFGSVEANIGFDLADIIRTKSAQSQYEYERLPPGKFNYGFTSQVGFQPLTWLALNGGLRYSYIDPNYHMLYVTVQPQFFLGDPKDEEFKYLFLNLGQKINKTAAKDAGFVGIGVGMIEPVNKNIGHKFQISLEDQVLDGEGNVFIGVSYGIVFFSNKKL